ncbi:MAG: hypothetical protein V9E94_20725 [Microthrixaceae bacterium]
MTETLTNASLYERGLARHTRRGELARSCVPVGRRHAVLRARRADGAYVWRRRGHAVRRLRAELRRGRSSVTPTRSIVEAIRHAVTLGTHLRCADTGRGPAGRGALRPDPRHGAGASGVSSGTEATMSAIRLARGATGRSHDREVRRPLPRPFRRAARRGRVRRRRGVVGDRHRPRLGGCDRRGGRRHRGSSPYNVVPSPRRARSLCVIVEAGRRQHGAGPAVGGLPRSVCAPSATGSAPCCCSTR